MNTTSKEAIQYLKHAETTIGQTAEALEMAIKVLEQGDVLDKIRAEIVARLDEYKGDVGYCRGLVCAKNLIDKYRESEE